MGDPDFAKMTVYVSCLFNYISLGSIMYILCFIGVQSGSDVSVRAETGVASARPAGAVQSLVVKIDAPLCLLLRRMFPIWLCLLLFFLKPCLSFSPSFTPISSDARLPSPCIFRLSAVVV